MAKKSPKSKAKKTTAKKPSATAKAKPANLPVTPADPRAAMPEPVRAMLARIDSAVPQLPTAGEGEVVSIKGFDAKLQCQGFQFEIGGSYEHKGKVICCPNSEQVARGDGGFHACPTEHHPLSVFGFYQPAGSRYAFALQGGTKADTGDTKTASARITIAAEITLPQLCLSAVRYVFERAKWGTAKNCTGRNEGALTQDENGAATASGYQGAATASGDQGAATASGDQGAATASGYQGAATASGYQGAATASGVRGAATASGDQGAATASGYQGAATASGVRGACMASGCDSRVKAAEGNAMFLIYRSTWDGPVEKVWAGIAGQDGIKPDTWYKLSADGKPVETA